MDQSTIYSFGKLIDVSKTNFSIIADFANINKTNESSKFQLALDTYWSTLYNFSTLIKSLRLLIVFQFLRKISFTLVTG